MNEERTKRPPEGGEDGLRRLLEEAGPRPEVPATDLAAIKTAARRDWRRLVDREAERRRGGWQRRAPLALAAALLVALAAGWWWRSLTSTGPAEVIARVERAEGAVWSAGRELAIGRELVSGSEVETWDAGGGRPVRLALRLSGGQSVRLDAGSRLRLLSASTLALEAGAVYVDSGGEGGALEVLTPLGRVRDIGTQFEVRLGDGKADLRVSVREGAVEIDRGESSHSAVAGERVTMTADGALDRRPVARWGPEWQWMTAAAPGLATDGGVLLGAYLDWLTRETGWQLRFADRELERRARAVEVQASLEGLSPAESIHDILPSTGFDYRLEDGVLSIGPGSGS